MTLVGCPQLRNLLNQLPSSLPEWNGPNFQTFNLQANLDKDRGLAGSLNQFLESTFGCGTFIDEHENKRIVNFIGKGPCLLAVVEFMEQCAVADPKESALLQKWVDDLTESAQIAIIKDVSLSKGSKFKAHWPPTRRGMETKQMVTLFLRPVCSPWYFLFTKCISPIFITF
jgi:hypothetical protein